MSSSKRRPDCIEDATLSNIKKSLVISTFGISAEMMSIVSDIASDIIDRSSGGSAAKPLPETFKSQEGKDWLDQAVIEIGEIFKEKEIPLRLDTPMKAKAMKGCFYYLRQNKSKRKWSRALREGTKKSTSWMSRPGGFQALSSTAQQPAASVTNAVPGPSSPATPTSTRQNANEKDLAPTGYSHQFSPTPSLSPSPKPGPAGQDRACPPSYAKSTRACPCVNGPARILDHTRIKLQNRHGHPIDSCLASEITGFNTRNPHFLEDEAYLSLQGLFMDMYQDLDPKAFRFEWWDPVDQQPKVVSCARHLRLAVQTMLSATGNEFFLFRCSPRAIDHIYWDTTGNTSLSASVGTGRPTQTIEGSSSAEATDSEARKRQKLDLEDASQSAPEQLGTQGSAAGTAIVISDDENHSVAAAADDAAEVDDADEQLGDADDDADPDEVEQTGEGQAEDEGESVTAHSGTECSYESNCEIDLQALRQSMERAEF